MTPSHDVRGPTEQTASVASSGGEAVAYLVHWWDDTPRCRVQMSDVVEPWLAALKPTITPLYTRATPDTGSQINHAVAEALEQAARVAETHQPTRIQQGKTLKAYDPEDREIIRAEENGEAIAASIIAAAIRALRPKDAT